MDSTLARRQFIRQTARALACTPLLAESRSIALVLDPRDTLVSTPPAVWAARELEAALTAAGFSIQRRERLKPNEFSIVASEPNGAFATAALPKTPESLALFERQNGHQRSVVACGSDARGVAYALTELADRARRGEALRFSKPIIETAANPVRSVMRQFTSELLDKPWFYDREQWTHYLDLLATNRWNRLDLAFGLGYDALNRVDDSYFLFFYPFVVNVPGYDVRVTNVSDAERSRNLETLRFISEQAVQRGIDFQLGVWMHGYRWPSGRAKNITEGLTTETHAPYCRDALTQVLKECPAISSVGLRIHGESGVAEGSYEFWATIFDGVKRCGRTVEIDLHAKGIDEKMIANALATGMPVNVSPKFSAEHFGMPYHQAAIREIEMPVAGHRGKGLMTLSEGSRVFTRYGYADLLREDRRYTVRHRVFSGTQRILLWDDPVSTAAYARMFQFCGSTGADLMEPLTCRGRRGSAVPGHRSGYQDVALAPKWDWEKYNAWYRTWGRLMYNPEAMPKREAHSTSLQSALANASRILPIITTAYLPSAACDAYWPELYWNQPLAAEPKQNPYGDTLAPKVFHNASPLDPQLFSGMAEFARELLAGRRSGKYSPAEVAEWLDHFAGTALSQLEAGRDANANRAVVDIRIQAGLGQFFAAKFRAGVLYALFEQTSDGAALAQALKQYRVAREKWVGLAEVGRGVYAADLSCSDRFDERGDWLDRLAGIDGDIAELTKKRISAGSSGVKASAAIAQVLSPPERERNLYQHRLPTRFRRGEPLDITIAPAPGHKILAARIHFRHVKQSERYDTQEMEAKAEHFVASVPGAYTDTAYPLQYYFELTNPAGDISLYPGFDPDPVNQPYFVVRQV